ncbi:MAG TPA: ATP-binding protein [Longimicrobiaceae bacterium]|nr:ATP-binding protein [Longimicrobiaceae bacterium]
MRDPESIVHDPARLAEVRATGLLDTGPEEVFDRLTRLAARVVGAPVSFIALVDEDRDFYKSVEGPDDPLGSVREIRTPTLCHYTLRSPEPLVIPDTRADPVFRHVPSVETLGVAAYVGVPLVTSRGLPIGSFCAVDFQPREWLPDEVDALREFAASAMREIELRRAARDARDAQRRIATILESVTDAFFALDRDWRFTYLNRGAREAVRALLQRPPEDAVGLCFWDVVPQFLGTRFEEEYRRAVETGQAAHFEEFAPAFGVWFDVNAYPSSDGLSVYFRDVTERHSTEEALRRSEEMLRQVAENIREVFWVSDPGYTRMYYVSPAYEALWGSSREELYRDPRSFLETVHPDDRARVLEAIPGMATGDYDVRYRIVRPDGTVRWLWARSSPVRDERGEIYRSVGIVEDITRLKEAEEEQERLLGRERQARDEAERRAVEEAALRRAAAAVTASFTVEEASRRIAGSALEATRADGAFVERVDADRWEIVVAAVAGERTPELGSRMPYSGSLTERAVETRSAQVAGPDGAGAAGGGDELSYLDRASSALVVPLLDAGEPIGTLVLVRGAERGEFRHDEVERARTFGDLAALAFRKIHLLEDSEKRREELERVTESRARLIRGFSHDLKNPLGAADGHAQLLQDEILGTLTERQRESVGRIRASIRSALVLINDLVELARAEAGQLELEPRPTDVREVARELAGDYRAQAESAGLRLLAELPDEFPVIRSDPTRVRQVLGNLISNGIKYNRPGGTITVRAAVRARRAGGQYAVVEVADTGIGIPEEKLGLLFQEFSRLAPGSAHGAGLGLAISQKIARALGGEITVETEPGAGSTFTLWLPADGAQAGTGG